MTVQLAECEGKEGHPQGLCLRFCDSMKSDQETSAREGSMQENPNVVSLCSVRRG